MSGVSFLLSLYAMPNDVGASILDPHEPQSLTPVANKFSCQSFSAIVHRGAKSPGTRE
jgi:hypothetical protein